MRKKLAAAILVLTLAGPAFTQGGAGFPAPGALGAGLELGDPLGGTAKWWRTETQAVQAGVGLSGDPVFYADYGLHSFSLLPQPPKGRASASASLGGRIEDGEFAIRTMFGLQYWLDRYPIETFFQVGPAFRVTREGIGVDASFGLRYYFRM